jgi:hypothetical protein
MLFQNSAIRLRDAVYLVEEAKGAPSKLLLSFLLFLGEPAARTAIATCTIMPQSTQIFSRKCLLGVSRVANKILGVKFASKVKIFLTIAQIRKSLITFQRNQIDGKFRQSE